MERTEHHFAFHSIKSFLWMKWNCIFVFKMNFCFKMQRFKRTSVSPSWNNCCRTSFFVEGSAFRTSNLSWILSWLRKWARENLRKTFTVKSILKTCWNWKRPLCFTYLYLTIPTVPTIPTIHVIIFLCSSCSGHQCGWIISALNVRPCGRNSSFSAPESCWNWKLKTSQEVECMQIV